MNWINFAVGIFSCSCKSMKIDHPKYFYCEYVITYSFAGSLIVRKAFDHETCSTKNYNMRVFPFTAKTFEFFTPTVLIVKFHGA